MNVSTSEAVPRGRAGSLKWCLAVGVAVLLAQLFLISRAGTDIPFQDQWDVEGRTLYPTWQDGSWRAEYFFQAHNEHRILWTKLLDVALLQLNGQWDPLVQMTASAFIRAAAAAALAWLLMQSTGTAVRARGWIALAVVVAFLPHLGWHNVLWGFQSQVYFSLLFSLVALGCLGQREPSLRQQIIGLLAGFAGLLAMASAALVPVALLGLVALRAIERRRWEAARWRELWPALLLLMTALALRTDVPEHAGLRAGSPAQFGEAWLRALAWPHTWMPVAALALNVPLLTCVVGRVTGRRRPAASEDLIVLIGGWSVAMAAAMAWSRGGSGEFAGAIPSRYMDFLVLLPVVNGWCAVQLVRETAPPRARLARFVGVAWGVFLLAGWLGLSTQMMQRIILPRMRDRDAPVRLAVAFQQSGDPAVFTGQPALLVPHPNAGSVRVVLNDPRMAGLLPPSFQPDKPSGPLSRAVRVILDRQ